MSSCWAFFLLGETDLPWALSEKGLTLSPQALPHSSAKTAGHRSTLREPCRSDICGGIRANAAVSVASCLACSSIWVRARLKATFRWCRGNMNLDSLLRTHPSGRSRVCVLCPRNCDAQTHTSPHGHNNSSALCVNVGITLIEIHRAPRIGNV